jgi:hypothetical protein
MGVDCKSKTEYDYWRTTWDVYAAQFGGAIIEPAIAGFLNIFMHQPSYLGRGVTYSRSIDSTISFPPGKPDNTLWIYYQSKAQGCDMTSITAGSLKLYEWSANSSFSRWLTLDKDIWTKVVGASITKMKIGEWYANNQGEPPLDTFVQTFSGRVTSNNFSIDNSWGTVPVEITVKAFPARTANKPKIIKLELTGKFIDLYSFDADDSSGKGVIQMCYSSAGGRNAGNIFWIQALVDADFGSLTEESDKLNVDYDDANLLYEKCK